MLAVRCTCRIEEGRLSGENEGALGVTAAGNGIL